MWAIVDDLATYGIYGAIGLGILGVVVWIVKSLVGAKARYGNDPGGGWRPPGRR